MKRKISLLLVAFMLATFLVACDDANDPDTPEGDSTGDYKIGVVTGTVSQGEEEYRAGERMIEEYGEDKIVHITYPDKFDQEVETTISQMSSLAADPDVKAIVVTQAVTGMCPSVDAIKESRDDILFIFGAPHEDPETVAERADVILELNQEERGRTIVEKAKDMGAETFVHYSFPRHMSMELLSLRRDIMKETCEELGIEFVEIDSPDPTAEGGAPATQQFILEDIPRQVKNYGKDTAFFGTNCAMQEAMIKTILEEKAIYPEQCCPSPYHAYPQALGIEIPEDKAGDLDYLIEQITEKVAEAGNTGRMGSWKKPANASMIEAGVKYAKAYLDGEFEDKLNEEKILEYMKEVSDDVDDEVQLEAIDEDKPNFLLFVLGNLVF